MDEGLGYGRRRLIDQIIKEHWATDPALKSFSYVEVLFVIQEMLAGEGKAYLESRHHSIHLGYEVFREFVKLLLYRNAANFDSMILITADKGMGKSSAAIMIAREWCKLLGIKFSPKRHIAYSNADVMNKIDTLNKFEPIIADEAVRFASGCIAGDTLIKTAKGWIKIKYLAGKKNLKVYSYNRKTNKIELQTARKCIKTKIDYVYEVKAGNSKILATKEHKFLTTKGWKKLSQLKVGDEIIGI